MSGSAAERAAEHAGDKSSPARANALTKESIRAIAERLRQDKEVRRAMPIWGRLHIDRQLPFLCVYRRPANGRAGGTDRLLSGEASYLTTSGAKQLQKRIAGLVEEIVETLAEPFGAFLLLELWEGDCDEDADEEAVGRVDAPTPSFRIVVPDDDDDGRHVEALRQSLANIRIARQRVNVDVVRNTRCGPPALPLLMTRARARALGCTRLGLEVRPIYRNPETDDVYPLLLRAMQRPLTRALRQGFYKFSCTQTTHCPLHYHMLGRRAVVKAVWEVDKMLAAVSSSYDFLLQMTPVNADEAWRAFKKSGFEKAPTFRYRPLPQDPVLLKRQLYQVPVERVEDPVLLQLFREKQLEIDRQVTMLLEMNTPRAATASVLLYGGTSKDEVRLARDILDKVPSRSRDEAGKTIDVPSFVRRAEEEIEFYREQWPEVTAKVKLRSDLAGGLMVSRGSLLVSRTARIPLARVEPLLQHEVGTHIVTYYNGRAQPFKQLYTGLAGYEALQEGLAVLSEYLVGGLSRPRLRLLAARVIAVKSLLSGASFVDTFRKLDREYDFSQRAAFQVTMRVYRGGGLTKDAIYLRGLTEVLDYLARGGDLAPLLIGKMATSHIPIIRELQWRRVLKDAPLRPRFLDAPGADTRLDRVRKGLSIMQLIDRKKR